MGLDENTIRACAEDGCINPTHRTGKRAQRFCSLHGGKPVGHSHDAQLGLPTIHDLVGDVSDASNMMGQEKE